MESTSKKPADDAPPPVHHLHHLAGFVLVALVNAITFAVGMPAKVTFGIRAGAQFHAAFQLVAVGLVVTGLAGLISRHPRAKLIGYALTAVVVGAIATPVLGEDLGAPAEKLPQAVKLVVWISVVSAVAAQAIPIAAALGSLLARPKIRYLGVALALGLAIVNGRILLQSYHGLHLLFAVVAATLAGNALNGARVVENLVPKKPQVRLAIAATLSLLAAASVLKKPANAVAVVLAQESTAVFAPFLGRLRAEVSSVGKIPEEQRAWFASSRAELPGIPASKPALLPQGPIVILLGVDSMRADLFSNDKYRDKLPALFALKNESTHFTRARAAGSSTAPSITAIFSSAYYSQLYWTHRANTNDPLVWPNEDEWPRLAEQLTADGVRTMTVEGLGWLTNEFGIVRGFEDQYSRRPTPAKQMIDKLIDRLGGHGSEPLFLFAHILDAHYPYGQGDAGASFDGYLAKLSMIDKEIGRLRDALIEFRLNDRTCFIVYADHGESFGEHNANTHSQNLYDEQIRVPLMFRMPNATARTVDTPVSLVDLAPTILDLMGVETPGVYMGQSLTGFLRGDKPVLRRPIAAEARLKRALITPEGFKVIRDPWAHSVEIYDLNQDPKEETNLYSDDSEKSAALVGVLDAFFEANTVKRRGYKVPYRKW